MNDKIAELEKQIEQMKNELEVIRAMREQGQKPVAVKDDPLFLLSSEEYNHYVSEIPSVDTCWWLRNSQEDGMALVIMWDGSVGWNGRTVGCCFSVRPAVRTSKLECDAEIVYNSARTRFFALGATWKVIDDNLAIAETPIMFSGFDEKSNDYATSEVRKKLLDWYKERVEW